MVEIGNWALQIQDQKLVAAIARSMLRKNGEIRLSDEKALLALKRVQVLTPEVRAEVGKLLKKFDGSEYPLFNVRNYRFKMDLEILLRR